MPGFSFSIRRIRRNGVRVCPAAGRRAGRRCAALAALVGLGAVPVAAAAVYLEDSPDAVQRARRAQEHLDAGRPGEAAALLQSVRVEFGARLMEREPGLYVDAARWVGLRLRDDPALRAAYRNRFDGEARRARDAAGSGGERLALTALAGVAWRYAGSGPGRDAALDLAARHVRAGRGAEARAVLDELAGLNELRDPSGRPTGTPPEPAAAARHRTLLAWAAALCGDAVGRDAALAGLAAVAGPEAAAALARQMVSPLAAAAPGAESARHPLAPRPLWRVTLAEPEPPPEASAPYRGYAAAHGNYPAELRAVARGDLILANDTQRVYALDAVSGRLRWSHAPAASAAEADPEAVWRGGGAVRTLPDARAVAAQGRDAFAVLGSVQTIRGRRGLDPMTPSSVLVCLDTARGDAVWTARPGDVDAVVARASFHGTPLLTPELVIVAARRSQVSSFQDSYLIAFDRRTGVPRWRRHVASTQGSEPRRGGDVLSSLSLDPDRGRVYFCDNLGAAAALSAATGEVRWLRVFDDADRNADTRRSGFSPLAPDAAPTPVRDGVLLPVRHGEAYGLLLDADTGRTRRALPTPSPLDGLTGLHPLPGGDALVCVAGGTVRRLSGDDLTERWAYAGGGAGVALAERGTGSSGQDGLLWLLDDDGQLTGRDADTGAIRRSVTLTAPGALVPVEHGVVTVSGRSFASYTPWPAAYATLRARAAQHPADAGVGLSMATLALNAVDGPRVGGRLSGDTDAAPEAPSANDPEDDPKDDPAGAVLRGIDHALRTLDTDDAGDDTPRGRAATLDALLALTERAAGTLDAADLTRIFDRLAGAARSPEELLSYTLARAGAAEQGGRPAEAADLYQAVLDHDALSSGRVRRRGVARRGGVVARQALQELIARAGPGVYAAHARRSAAALAELDRRHDTDPAPYLALAHRYPLGAPAAEALLKAGRLQAAGAAPAAAATTLRRSYRLSVDDATRAEAASTLARHYVAQGRPGAAARWLAQVDRDGPRLRLTRDDDAPVTAARWAAELAGHPDPVSGPRLSLPLGPAVIQPGRLLTAAETHGGTPRTPTAGGPRVLLRGPEPGVLALYDTASPAAARWRIEDDDRGNALADLGADTAVLWSAAAGRVTVRAVADGAELFPPVATEELLAELGEGGRVAAARRAAAGASIAMIEGDFSRSTAESRKQQAQLSDARDDPPRVIAGEAAVAVLDAVGRAAAFDRYTGVALWHLELPIDSVRWARVVDGLLLIGGLRGAGTGAEAGVVLALDLTTGRTHTPDLEDPAPPLWAGLGPRGDMLVLRAGELSSHDPRSGAVRWRADFDPLAGPARVRVAAATLAASDGIRLVTVDLDHGAVTGQTVGLLAGTRLLAGRDRLLLDHDRAGLTALHPDARTAWRSAAAQNRKGPVAVALLDGAVLIAATAGDRGAPTVELFRLDLATGRITDRQLTGLSARLLAPDRLAVVDDALLLTDREQTLIVPGAAAPRRGPN